MLGPPRWIAPTYTGGQIEHYRALVLRVIAPPVVQYALSNIRRAG
jgi:hypothetical protein